MLEFLCLFDWLHPLIAKLQDLRYGRPYTFLIYEGQGVSWRDVAALLRSRNIRAWGPCFMGHCMLLSVPYSKREFAQNVLDSHRVQVANPVRQEEQRRGLLARLVGR